MKHTPGPWTAELDIDWSNIYGPHGVNVAHCEESIIATSSGSYEIKTEECQANASLISAAPDMYEALKKVVSCASTPDAVMELVRLALAKAEGRPGGIL